MGLPATGDPSAIDRMARDQHKANADAAEADAKADAKADAFRRAMHEAPVVGSEVDRHYRVDFSTAPQTLGEIRSDRSGNSKDWTLRDALVTLLREIDSGQTPAVHGVIVWAERGDDGRIERASFLNATPDGVTAMGLLARASYRINAAG
jgi:hypothetical protein